MTNIVFLVLPNVHLLDLAGADQVFLEAIDYGAELRIQYCSTVEAPATSSGLPMGKLPHFKEIQLQAGDFILIPGADLQYLLSTSVGAERELFDWLRQAHRNRVRLASICTGAFLLGRAGLLDHKKCTTHWKRTTELKTHFPKAKVAENILFTEDEGIYTSAGVAAGIDLALHILSTLKDEYFAYQIARELVVYTRRAGTDAQESIFLSYRNHIHTGIHKVQDWLQDNLHQKATLDDLADVACMTTRTLTRVFRKETGITVNDYITLLRQEKIRALRKNPDLSKAQIARHCGLLSERQISRLMKAGA